MLFWIFSVIMIAVGISMAGSMGEVGIALPFFLWVGLGVIARVNIPILSPIIRWIWNLLFTITACIPLCGWMARFIVATTPEEIAKREILIKIGSDTDDFAISEMAAAAEREEARRRRDEAIRSRLAAEGIRCTNITSDGSRATGTDKHGNKYDIRIERE